MLEFSPEKMAFIFLIVLMVLGPEKLPEVSRKIGKAMGELRKLSGGFQDEMRKAVHEVSSDSGSSSSTGDSGESAPAPSAEAAPPRESSDS